MFAPVARIETVRVVLALAAQEDWKVHHMDVKFAFLNGDLKEEVYVEQHLGYEKKGEEGKVFKLKKGTLRVEASAKSLERKVRPKFGLTRVQKMSL